MNNKQDTKRLAEAVTNLAATITEVIELKVKELTKATKPGEPVCSEANRLTPAEGWASKQETAEYLKISLGTLSHWMKKGAIPYVKIGRGVRFKLSQVDEAMKRRVRAGY